MNLSSAPSIEEAIGRTVDSGGPSDLREILARLLRATADDEVAALRAVGLETWENALAAMPSVDLTRRLMVRAGHAEPTCGLFRRHFFHDFPELCGVAVHAEVGIGSFTSHAPKCGPLEQLPDDGGDLELILARLAREASARDVEAVTNSVHSVATTRSRHGAFVWEWYGYEFLPYRCEGRIDRWWRCAPLRADARLETPTGTVPGTLWCAAVEISGGHFAQWGRFEGGAFSGAAVLTAGAEPFLALGTENMFEMLVPRP